MRLFTRIQLLAALLLLSAHFLMAQTPAGTTDQFAGHWEGTVQIPSMELKIEIDLAKNSKGEFAGTFSSPARNVKGLPLSTVAVDGRTVRLILKAGREVSTFVGVLSADATSIAGDASQGSESVPFYLKRTGEAQIAAAPKSPPITKELEGTWNGTLDVGERKVKLVITMANQPDGTATGMIVSQDGSGMEIPIAMTQKASNLTIDVPSVGASYVGVLNAAGTELAGTWKQGTAVLPLTFQRADAAAGKK